MVRTSSAHSATCIGCDAAAALSRAGRGTVAAVFARSFYLRFGDDWICLGGAEIGAGPLNVLCNWQRLPDWRTRIAPTQTVSVNDEAITLLHDLTVSIAQASTWRPSPTAAWERDRARRGLIALDQNLLSEFPSEGLGCFILKRPTTQSRIAAAALPAIGELESWIRTGSASLPEKTVLELLGLGPGLTPSGDDFLAGTLCTLRAVGRADAADALWRLIEPASWVATVSISRAHLQSAARGHLAADLHGLLDALLAGAPGGICNGLGLLKKRDHSSPWDCLAGIAVSLRAVVAGNRGGDGSHSGNDPATSRFKHEADPSSEPRHSRE